ncbi:MAG: hypothetical protein V4683_05155 [Bacteroidota bacterium]
MQTKQLSNLFTLSLILFLQSETFAQLGINESSAAPNPSAMLHVDSPNKGILIPRMSTLTRDGIGSPPDGLMIYNNQTKKFNYFNNTIWQEALFGDIWELNGTSLSYSTGFVGIGSPTPTRNLVLNSADGPDILIQQSAFSGNTANDGFMLGTNTNLDGEIWNFESADIKFGASNIERMRITSSGNVGINNEAPTEKLDVNGNINVSLNILLSGTSEVNRTSTGAANMIPIAYGNVSAAGGILGGTGNFTVSKVPATNGIYEITVTGEAINSTTNYIFSAVSLSANPQFSTTYPFSGVLRVETFEIGGSNQDGTFSFVIYKL